MASDDEGARYEACAEAMKAAAYAYARAHPFAEYRFAWFAFEREMARRAGKELHAGESAAIAAALVDCIEGVGESADARGMLRAMWDASLPLGGGTYMMAKAIVMQQLEAQVERVTAQITLPGHWRCIGCDAGMDGYTPLNLEPSEGPRPGSITVCSACGALQQVNGAGDGYAALPAAVLNGLPKSARMALLGMRNSILARLARERGRS